VTVIIRTKLTVLLPVNDIIIIIIIIIIMKFILLLNVEDDLFKSCYGKDEEWDCELKSLGEDCSEETLEAVLADPDLLCCVVQDTDTPHWNVLHEYYYNALGGFIVFFGIYGEFAVPAKLSSTFGLEWSFSAYTNEDYVLTDVGNNTLLGGDRCLGIPAELDAVKQHLLEMLVGPFYTKAVLLKVPPEDRILTARKPKDIREYLVEVVGCDLEDAPENLEDLTDPDLKQDYEEARDGRFADYCRQRDELAPLVMHRALSKNGARIAYVGFVNGTPPVPDVVRALLTSG
jgi:hypothetical protein